LRLANYAENGRAYTAESSEATELVSQLVLAPYLGGKQFMVDTLLPLLPRHRVYVEVFGGAASLLLNKPPSEVEVYNDVDGDLVNLLMALRDHADRLIPLVDSLPYSRKLHHEWREDYVRGVRPEDPVEAAARYYLLLSSCFAGGFFKGWRYERQHNSPEAFHNRAQHLPDIASRLRNVLIDCLDYRRCIANWDSEETLFFLDPPYYSMQGKQYRHEFSPQDHEELASLLSSLKAKWLLTYGDHPRIREIYKAYHMVVSETHMASQGRTRFTSEEVLDSDRPKLANLIITNYDPATTPRFAGTSQGLERFLSMIVDQAWTMRRRRG
jgi:DNA adenine methylase